MANIDYTLPILDIVAIILALASLIISLAIAYGIIGSKEATEKVHSKLSDIHDHLTSTNDRQMGCRQILEICKTNL
jgi:hypothetical protein